MASKLYPPILEASIPAFYGNMVVIPFKHNPLVSPHDYKGFVVQIKKINGDVVDGTPIEVSKDNVFNNQITVILPVKLVASNWYKFSIAYKSDTLVGYYSTSAVGKYLGEQAPYVYLNYSEGVYKGVYNHEDPSEKAYSYQFILIDNYGRVLEDTGEKIHNVELDDSVNSSSDVFYFKYDLSNMEDASFYLTYILTTVNGIILKTSLQIVDGLLEGVDLGTKFNLVAKLNREEGAVEIWGSQFTADEPITGNFVLRKVCSKDNFLRVQTITHFTLINKSFQGQVKLCEDLTCEAGYYYKYYIQQYNKHEVFSAPVGVASNPLYVSFDDSFLYDGEKQLKILYNPKVSSFKENILQSKTDTIGSKYPFITRNGIVGYKEFPISGLISFQTDENKKFMPIADQIRLGIMHDRTFREATPSAGLDREEWSQGENSKYDPVYMYQMLHRENDTDLNDININAEREFKLMVLDFLNSKKPKLFRSATEGNYCVYTMNSSLSPNDTLGRMLHTFNTTAYEIMPVADFYDGLMGLGFEKLYETLPIEDFVSTYFTRSMSIFRSDKAINYNFLYDGEYARNFQIRDADPMSKYTISFVNFKNMNAPMEKQVITIGSTGSYNYFCTEPYVYISGVRAGGYYEADDGKIKYKDISYYTNITFRNFIYISQSDFEYLIGAQDVDSLGAQIAKGQKFNSDKISDREAIQNYLTEIRAEAKSILDDYKDKNDYEGKHQENYFKYQELFKDLLPQLTNSTIDSEEYEIFFETRVEELENLIDKCRASIQASQADNLSIPKFQALEKDAKEKRKMVFNAFSLSICAHLEAFISGFEAYWKMPQSGFRISGDLIRHDAVLSLLYNNINNLIAYNVDIKDLEVPNLENFLSRVDILMRKAYYNRDANNQQILKLQSPDTYTYPFGTNFSIKDGKKEVAKMGKLYLLRARNFNEHQAEFAVFGFDDTSRVKQVLNKYKAEKQEGDMVIIPEFLYSFLVNNGDLDNYFTDVKELNQSEQKFAIQYYGASDGFDPRYIGYVTDPAWWTISYDIQTTKILVPPSSTVVLQYATDNPGNFYYSGDTGDNIVFDMSFALAKREYDFSE